jgi:predicted nucleic acid-binding protein
MNVLVDTSVWSLALRRKPEHLNPEERKIVDALTELIREGRVRIIGLVRQELLSGVRAVAQFEKLKNFLRAFPDESITAASHELAAKLSNDCRSKGIVVSVVDVLICALALEQNLEIFTTDPDFEHYRKIIPIKLYSALTAQKAPRRN